MPVIVVITIMAISALYVPQPLLPLLAETFGVSMEQAALFTTITFIPLSLAPLFYGYLLESISPRRLVQGAVILLALSELPFLFSDSFGLLLGVRLLQGFLVPAILTALMTLVSSIAPAGLLQRYLSIYIASTILGGFLGRAGSGLIASLSNWRMSFLTLGVSLLAGVLLTWRLPADARLKLVKPHPRDLWRVASRCDLAPLYLGIFGMFWVFAAIMNFLPFRLAELNGSSNAGKIGSIYLGYLAGIGTSLAAGWIARRFGGSRRVLVGTFTLYLGTLVLFLPRQQEMLFFGMFLFCAAMFLIHSTATGLANRIATDQRGIVNGLYVAFYYGGGTLGSLLPGYLYRGYGWEAFLIGLGAIALLSLIALTRLPQETTH